MEFTYFSKKIVLNAEESAKLLSLEVDYVDKEVDQMSPADIIHNLQMLQKRTIEKDLAAEAIQDNAALKARILELEADLVKYQKLYFAISRPPPA